MTVAERIVIGIDEASASQAAADWVITRVGARSADLTLVTAVDELMIDRGQDEILERTRARMAKQLPAASIDVVSAEGPLVQVVSEQATLADLLVVGNYRTRSVRSVLSGSAALRIAGSSPVPTVVVPDDVSSGTGPIVLGIAEDTSSEGAIQFAAGEARRTGTALEIVHAWGPPAASEVLGFPDHSAAIVAEHRAVLESAARRIRAQSLGLQVVDILVGEDAADALVDRAGAARMIVIGTHGNDHLTGLLRGSVGRSVVTRSRVPVCVVPAAWRPKT